MSNRDQKGARAPERQEEMAELGVMTASLLHELRQPLFAIKGLAQLVAAEHAGDDRLAQLLEQVGYLEHLVDHYGSFARGSGGTAPYDLNEPVRGAVEMLAVTRKRSGVEVRLELAAEPLLVRGRPHAARQVAINLLHNALDAVESTTSPWITVRTRLDGTHVRLEVEDSGTGQPSKVGAELFQPFVTSKPPGRGTGLGLYIVYKLVREAAGELELKPTDQGGTIAVMRLPRA